MRADLPDCLLAAHDTPPASLPDWFCVRNGAKFDSEEGIGGPADTFMLMLVSVSTEAHVILSNQVC